MAFSTRKTIKLEPVITLNNVSKTFTVPSSGNEIVNSFKSLFNFGRHRKIKALNNVSFTIEKGEVFGIVGANGSGKSTLLNLIMQNYLPDTGSSININGKMIRLTLGMGVDPHLSGRENIYINGSVIGLTFKEISKKYDQIIDFADLKGFEHVAVKYYSKGMKNRLLFSIAIHADADIFLLDEFFGGVGDERFKERSDQVFEENITKKNTILIVTHQLKLITQHCTRALWLDKGNVKMLGKSVDVIREYKKFMSSHNRKL